MLVPAKMCNTMQYAEKQTQNPPPFGAWGFDPPSRHQSFRISNLGVVLKAVLRNLIAILDFAVLAAEVQTNGYTQVHPV
jgi:hypothetical protein